MNDAELLEADRLLRQLLEGTELEWVLDEVDAAIAEGISEERILRRRPQKNRSRRGPDLRAAASEDYTIHELPLLSGEEYESSRKTGTLVITTRAMTVRERVLQLIDAVRRVTVELPTIEAETIALLKLQPHTDDPYEDNNLWRTAGSVESVVFEPEEDFTRRTDRQITISARITQERRDGLVALFSQVREAVISE